MYETWGTYDVQILVWSNDTTIGKVREDLESLFPTGDSKVYSVDSIEFFHTEHFRLADDDQELSVLEALSIQDGIATSEIDEKAYIIGDFPSEEPEHSIRAFTFVDAVSSPVEQFTRTAILHNVRDQLRKLAQMKNGTAKLFPTLFMLEFAAKPGHPVCAINFVCLDFKNLYKLPTAIIELGPTAVRTASFIETRRIVIQSDKILFD